MTRADLILVNLGTPNTPTEKDVRAFLAEFLGDPMVVEKPRWLWLPILHGIILRRRPKVVAKAYAEIWAPDEVPGGSPLAVGTRALAKGASAAAKDDLRVTYAYRYGSPNLESRLQAIQAESPGSDHPVTVLPLFAQQTASSTGTVHTLVRKLSEKLGLGPRLQSASIAPDDPGYIEALAHTVRDRIADFPKDAPIHLLSSFHGIPCYINEAEGSQYTTDCHATFEALKHNLGWTDNGPPPPFEGATLAYQSKFGRDPWITPSTEDTLAHLGAQKSSVLLVAPSFLTPGLETVEELGIQGRETFQEAGGQTFALANAPTQTAPPREALIQALLNLAQH
ncbi:MAG: ferrochelatase [Planctomycetota bacterium]|nr:ferrochelatase [Planctomycetota bacterium]MDG2144830.1 ferrochelatase [Planctomycetota bacterium]